MATAKENRESFKKGLSGYLKITHPEYPNHVVDTIIRHLVTYEHRLARLAEMECDGEYYNKYWKNGVNPEQEKYERHIEDYIKRMIGCKCYTQRDPRGIIIRLYLNTPENHYYSNSWDGETSGVTW